MCPDGEATYWLRALRRLGRHLAALTVLATFVAVLGFSTPAQAVSDPYLRWYTIETPHFRITYHSGIERVALVYGPFPSEEMPLRPAP